MKNTFLFFSFVFLMNILHAQDIIIKNNGDTVLAKIIEIMPDQIRYKRADFPDGPNYLQLKSELAVIRYENGRRETFAKASPAAETYVEAPKSNQIAILRTTYIQNGMRLPENHLYAVLLNTKDPKIATLVAHSQKFKGLQYVGFLAIPLGIAGLAACSTNKNDANFYAAGLLSMGAAISCPIVAGIFKQKRQQRLNEAIKIYNENY